MDPDDITTATLCDLIGRRIVAERMGVRKQAVSNAVAEGRFPARWFCEMRTLCAEHDLPCPDRLFNFLRSPAARSEEDAA